MPKFGRPFVNLENDLKDSSREKRRYMYDEGSEVTRNAPFGTYYTPRIYTKIVGSKYMKFQGDQEINDPLDMDTGRSGKASQTKEELNKRPVLPPIYNESQRDYDLSELSSLLPPGMNLPSKPIFLKNNEQLSLLKLIKYEIKVIPDFISKLKEIYCILVKIDFNLTGLCSFKEFIESFNQKDVHLSWKLFRIVASQFVVPNRDDVSFVHYEKIISFLGAVYRSLDESERLMENQTIITNRSSQDKIDKPVYFHDEYCIDVGKEENPHEEHFNIIDTKIIKQIIDDVGFHPIPLQRIRLSFQRSDSLHRGTVSAHQIWDIFQSEGLILRKDTFDKILNRCKHMSGGQFSWEELMEFLEKIQPINTGLQIPSSRMPIDYMKKIPEPASSWPHAEDFKVHHEVSESQNFRGVISDTPTPRNKDFSQQYNPVETSSSGQNINLNSVRSVPSISQQSSSRAQIEPWLNRFLKFVDSIYLKDVHSRGILPTREVYEASTLLNDQLNLNLKTTEIISALEGSAIDNDRLYTNINQYLKKLAIR